MDELEAGVLASGEKSVRLDVSLPSRGFYERRGYTVVADRFIDVGDGQQLLYWEAEKRPKSRRVPRMACYAPEQGSIKT